MYYEKIDEMLMFNNVIFFNDRQLIIRLQHVYLLHIQIIAHYLLLIGLYFRGGNLSYVRVGYYYIVKLYSVSNVEY